MGNGVGASGRAAASCPDDPSSIPLGTWLFSLSIKQWGVIYQAPLRRCNAY